jgi:hypothetical protein
MPQPTTDESLPPRIETGALDDGRHRVRHYVVAALGWVATAGAIIYLAVDATVPAVRVSVFLATVCVLVALVSVLVAVELFRQPLIAERARSLPTPAIDEEIDALGRKVEAPSPDALAGEVTIATFDGVRRYEETGP